MHRPVCSKPSGPSRQNSTGCKQHGVSAFLQDRATQHAQVSKQLQQLQYSHAPTRPLSHLTAHYSGPLLQLCICLTGYATTHASTASMLLTAKSSSSHNAV